MSAEQADWFGCVADAIAAKCGTRPNIDDLFDAEYGPPSDDADAVNFLIDITVLESRDE